MNLFNMETILNLETSKTYLTLYNRRLSASQHINALPLTSSFQKSLNT